MSDEINKAQQEAIQRAKEARWLEIFKGLGQSKRFHSFVENNFDIVEEIDHENKSIHISVVEKPISVGPPLTADQTTAILGALKMAKCPNAVQVADQILRVLGQEEQSKIITGVTDQDIKALSDDFKLKL